MAGFLFRKQKQDHSNKSSVVISSPTTLQSPPATPLYSRLSASSPRDAIGAATPVRKVSLPKPLGQSRGQRGNGVEGKYGYSSNSLASVDRDGQRKNMKVQDVTQRPQLSGGNSFERPTSQLLVDKPLPPPVPSNEDKPTTPAITTFARPRPTAFPQQMQKRMSLNADKPLPRPGSSQSSLPIPTSTRLKNSLSRTRLPSTSSSSIPQTADIQTNIQRQWPPSTFNQNISNDPDHGESTTIKIEDSPIGTPPIAETPVLPISTTSSDSISSTQWTSGKRSSESVKDHPEALSSQNFNEIKHVPSQSSSFNSHRPLDHGSSASGKSFDQQSLVSTSSAREAGGDMTLLQPGSSVKPSTSRRGLPSPPSTPFASNASSLSRSSIISAYHELYPAHVIMDNERRHSTLGTEQQRPLLHRNQTAAQPLSPIFQPTNIPRQNGISERQPPLRKKTQQHLYPELHQPPLTSSHSNPVTLTKSPSLQSNVSSPPRGKPRIFAAMEAQENNRPRPSLYASPLFLSPPEIQQDIRPLSFTSQSLNEEYSTPKLQIESLPDINPNEDVDSPTTIKAVDPYNDAPGLEPHVVQQSHSMKSSGSRSVARQDDTRSQNIPHIPRTKKLSKVRHPTDVSTVQGHTSNGSTSTLPGSSDGGHQKRLHKSKNRPTVTSEQEPTVQLDEETIRNAGMPLDDDPFARVEGVKMLKPTTGARHKSSKENSLSSLGGDLEALKETLDQPQQEDVSESKSTNSEHRQKKKKKKEKPPVFFFDPALKKDLEPATMPRLLLDTQILACLLQYLSFFEWCILLSLSKEIRSALVRNSALRETALERFLKTIGYSRWIWDDEPLSLSLQDLFDYMRGVSTPTHEYSRIAAIYIHSLKMPTTHRDPSVRQVVQRFVASTRAYNRVLLRLRAQVEKEATLQTSAQARAQSPVSRAVNSRLSPTTRGGNSSRPSSRAPSPTASYTSFNHSMSNGQFPGSFPQANSSQTNLAFRSPLFKLRRAPLLRVFVPSPEGDWLSDKSVLECEAECKRAGVQHLLRLGDVVWDVAVGDEGNVGRLVWDGNFLIDLDYTYSAIGDLPKYLHALGFPPSYFHRVIRTGHTNSNPIIHIDITPWGQEIMTNLQLTQDRIRTETSQGAYHNLMRWVNRSSFQLRPVRGQQPGMVNRIPIPKTDSLFVDPGWYGTIVVETEGTNEAVADMRDRCGLGAVSHQRPPIQAQVENRKVFRILRERSRPGEIWIRAVSMKERLL